MLNIAALALRAFLLIFGAVVLGLSITLAKHQVIGSPPAETSFNSFAGAFGIIVSLLALLSLFVDKIPAVGVMAADALASVFYLAGAIALTLALKSVKSCTASDEQSRYDRYLNKLLNGGCTGSGDTFFCPNAGKITEDDADSYTAGRCQKVQADYVFGYLGFAFGVAAIVITFLTHKRGGRTTATYV